MPDKKPLIPETWKASIKEFVWRIFGLCIFLAGVVFIISLCLYHADFAGFQSASDFGTRSWIGNAASTVNFYIGWIPSIFLFLFIARCGLSRAARWENDSPEFDWILALAAIVFGVSGLGAALKIGGLAGAVVARDLHFLIGGWTTLAGAVFCCVFLLLAGIVLRIKWSDVAQVLSLAKSIILFFARALHIYQRPPADNDEENDESQAQSKVKEKRIKNKKEEIKTVAAKKSPPKKTAAHAGEFSLPSPLLLAKSVFTAGRLTQELRDTGARMEKNFEKYGVFGRVAGIKPGPIITLYEFEPADGMRFNDITKTVQDMARAMATEKIRIAPIPMTTYVGVEMVNPAREDVRYQTMMSNPDFINSRYELPLALGVDIGGRPVIVNLGKMPHALIAGRTGSGKSVFVQSILMSLVYHNTPGECRIIIVDPKGVDFTQWRDIPHLAAPIVANDAQKAVNVLKWAVREMDDRFAKLKKLGANDLAAYNAEAARLRESGEAKTERVLVGKDEETGSMQYEERPVDLSHIPYLVIIIDEVSDLMSVARKEVEAAVLRLAQKARAAGIHVIAATQRPDTSVITGVIKANFPTRISFQARSNIDSMTTLGEKGAEQLLAFGDMLYSEAGKTPLRIHGAWIDNSEIRKVADFLRAQSEPQYFDGVGEDEDPAAIDFGAAGGTASVKDPAVYARAVEIVRNNPDKINVSFVQRQLGVGYNKAAIAFEELEKNGIISSPDGNKKRHLV